MAAETERLPDGRINLNLPRWKQDTFYGRLRHFISITDYTSIFVPKKKYYEAKKLLEQYRIKNEPEGIDEREIWRAKKLYDSAFHPDSKEFQNLIGRMSFQVPGGMILTAGMLQFYKSNTAVVFWQWLNQSFNALVNYTNRNAASDVTYKQIAVAYVSATTSALITALSFKSIMTRRARPIFQRFVPFLAVSAANLVNIPVSRMTELQDGVALLDEENNTCSTSKIAAVKGISLVSVSRITMAAPGMLIMPVIMDYLEKKPKFMRYRSSHIVFQTIMVGCFLTVMVPVACALFPQKSHIPTKWMQKYEPEKYEKLLQKYGSYENIPRILYFNKGL